jgi:hypothetical protein
MRFEMGLVITAGLEVRVKITIIVVFVVDGIELRQSSSTDQDYHSTILVPSTSDSTSICR